ncbi:helix-turn-helix domain-containing protein [Actinomadura luzonensis]|nr:helix-turn-helix transcriptional regulator [Actinomadura luzonensis]
MTEIPDRDSLQSGPSALRLLIGAHLRRLREAAGVTREAAAYTIRGSQSKISRMEAGRTSFKPRDVTDLLLLYGVRDQAERDSLLALVAQANVPRWWQEYRDVVPDWFEPYLGLEQDAALIRGYAVQFVPALLQTEGYAREVLRSSHEGEPAERVERLLAVRLRRRRILDPPAPRKLWAVLDEGVLHRRVGDEETMRAQLEHLARMAERPHVTLQVFPFSAGAALGGGGPVTLLRFAQEGLGDMVYAEHLTGAQFFTKEAEVRPYRHLLNELGVHAPPPAETPAILRGIIARL